jgi:hypothetical protein
MRFERMRRLAMPVLAAAILLSACETTVFDSSADEPTTAPPPCPRVSVVADADRLTRFQGAGRDVTDVQFEAEVRPPRSGCVYRDTGEIVISMIVPLVVARGPANQDGVARFNYFVAIARGEQVLVRQRFDVEVIFEGNQTRVGYVDELEQTIPLQGSELGSSYVVYVGIELTPAEMEFNRQR